MGMSPLIKNDRAAWLQGPSADCTVLPAERKNPCRLVLLGAPGVGKGTQAEILTARLGACHLSTGDVFRAASKRPDCEQSPAMKAATQYMRRGDLVPDSTVWEMVRERSKCIIHCGGFILDGFPRTLGQAQSLKELMEQEALSLSAVVEGICDRCGGRLLQREDDRPEAIAVRLEAYDRSTAPLIQFYKDLGLLLPILAKGSPEEIAERTIDRLNALAG
jgi:adenylate kinase